MSIGDTNRCSTSWGIHTKVVTCVSFRLVWTCMAGIAGMISPSRSRVDSAMRVIKPLNPMQRQCVSNKNKAHAGICAPCRVCQKRIPRGSRVRSSIRQPGCVHRHYLLKLYCISVPYLPFISSPGISVVVCFHLGTYQTSSSRIQISLPFKPSLWCHFYTVTAPPLYGHSTSLIRAQRLPISNYCAARCQNHGPRVHSSDLRMMATQYTRNHRHLISYYPWTSSSKTL
jgi:hypothetical protein